MDAVNSADVSDHEVVRNAMCGVKALADVALLNNMCTSKNSADRHVGAVKNLADEWIERGENLCESYRKIDELEDRLFRISDAIKKMLNTGVLESVVADDLLTIAADKDTCVNDIALNEKVVVEDHYSGSKSPVDISLSHSSEESEDMDEGYVSPSCRPGSPSGWRPDTSLPVSLKKGDSCTLVVQNNNPTKHVVICVNQPSMEYDLRWIIPSGGTERLVTTVGTTLHVCNNTHMSVRYGSITIHEKDLWGKLFNEYRAEIDIPAKDILTHSEYCWRKYKVITTRDEKNQMKTYRWVDYHIKTLG